MISFYTFPKNVFFNESFYKHIEDLKNILIVHSKSFKKEEIKKKFKNKNISYIKLTNYNKIPNSKALKDSKYDLVVAIGGGSVIDISKIIYAKVSNKNFDISNKNFNFKKNKTKFAVVVTLPGSGAEVSKSCVFNVKQGKSFYINKFFIPDYIYYDINRISKLNYDQIKYRVIDSIMHCLESNDSIISSKFSNIITEQIVEFGISTLKEILKSKSPNIGKEIAENISILSFYGGFSQSESGTGICHALAHSFENILKLPHAKAIFLCTFIKIKYDTKISKFNYNDLFSILKKLYKNNKHYEREYFNNLLLRIDFKKILENAKQDICWKLGQKKIDEKKLNYILYKFKERKTWIT